jgi:Cd2+/Zn2+-exporting ATPase
MFEQKNLSIPLSLRENGNCFNCTSRLLDDIKRLKGIKKVEVREDPCGMLIEYDPNFTSMEVVENYAIRQGLKLKIHYSHEHYNIEGLDCPDCALKLEQRLSKIPGVTWVSLNFATSKIWFEYETEEVTSDKILSVIKKAGYNYSEPGVSKIATHISVSSYNLTGLDCPDCAAKLQKKLSKLEGVEEVLVNFGTSSMTVKHDRDLINRADIIVSVRESGYDATISSKDVGKGVVSFFSIKNKRLLFTVLSGIFVLCAVITHLFKTFIPFHSIMIGNYHLTVSHLFYFFAIVSGGYYVAKSAYHSIIVKIFDMNFLMSVAVIGALAIGEVEEGAMVVFLFALGNLLQSYTMDKARNAIRMLMDLAPKEANLKRGGNLLRVPISELTLGNLNQQTK